VDQPHPSWRRRARAGIWRLIVAISRASGAAADRPPGIARPPGCPRGPRGQAGSSMNAAATRSGSRCARSLMASTLHPSMSSSASSARGAAWTTPYRSFPTGAHAIFLETQCRIKTQQDQIPGVGIQTVQMGLELVRVSLRPHPRTGPRSNRAPAPIGSGGPPTASSPLLAPQMSWKMFEAILEKPALECPALVGADLLDEPN